MYSCKIEVLNTKISFERQLQLLKCDCYTSHRLFHGGIICLTKERSIDIIHTRNTNAQLDLVRLHHNYLCIGFQLSDNGFN